MGMAPTTSTTMMLSLGDALAVALMERKGFSPDQYRDFHPGGSLGRALIRVADLMHSGDAMPLATPDTAMRDVLLTMASARLGCVGIVDGDGALVGIVTDGDIRRHVEDGIETARPREVMTRGPKIADRRSAGRRSAGPDERKEDHPAFRAGRKDRASRGHPAHP